MIDFVVWNPRTTYCYRTTFTKGKRYYENGSWSFIFLLMWSFLLWAKNEGFHLKSYTFRLHFSHFIDLAKILSLSSLEFQIPGFHHLARCPSHHEVLVANFINPYFSCNFDNTFFHWGLRWSLMVQPWSIPDLCLVFFFLAESWFMFSCLLKISYENYLTDMFCLKVSRKNIMLTTISYLYD